MSRPKLKPVPAVERGPDRLDASRFAPTVRRRLSAPGFRTFLAIADLWKLSEEQRRLVLGFPSRSTYHNWSKLAREHGEFTLDVDTLTRISAVLGIHQALGILHASEIAGVTWLATPNSATVFGGRPPLALAVSGSLDGLLTLRRFLDASRGGGAMEPNAVDRAFAPYADTDIVSPVSEALAAAAGPQCPAHPVALSAGRPVRHGGDGRRPCRRHGTRRLDERPPGRRADRATAGDGVGLWAAEFQRGHGCFAACRAGWRALQRSRPRRLVRGRRGARVDRRGRPPSAARGGRGRRRLADAHLSRLCRAACRRSCRHSRPAGDKTGALRARRLFGVAGVRRSAARGGRAGILYDSVRLRGAVNIAAYRPSKVLDVVQAEHYEIAVSAAERRIEAHTLPGD